MPSNTRPTPTAIANRRPALSLFLLAAAAAVIAGPAHAADPQQGGSAAASQTRATNNPSSTNTTANTLSLIDPGAGKMNVTASELYKGFRASRLMDQKVMGPNGNQLGDVRDVIVNQEGKIVAVVVEGGGFLNIGDAAFRVKWGDVATTPNQDGIQVPITEDKAGQYGLFDGPETLALRPHEFRVSEIIGDTVRLKNGTGYGRVSDVVFNRGGQMLGVLVNRDLSYGAGLYGYPFYGYDNGWTPTTGYYALPYDSVDLASQAPRINGKDFGKNIL